MAISDSNTTKAAGDAAEDRALAYLAGRGLALVSRNYRTPHRGGGEIDLVMRDGDTLVFIEVRKRSSRSFGGAAASVGGVKQRRVVFAARHFLMRYREPPPCRFDVVGVEGERIDWLKAAFDAG